MKKNEGYAWVIFLCMCAVSLVGFGLVINTVGLFYEPVGKAFGVGRGSVALMSTMQNIAAAITLLFAGKVMTKINLKWVLAGCFAIIGLSLASLSFARSITHFYIAWILIGICQPFAIALPIPVILGNWFKKKLGTVMGIALGISAFGGTIFNPIISSIITANGWRAGWLAEGLIVLIVLVPMSLFLLKGKPDSKHAAYGQGEVEENAEVEETGITLKEATKTPMFYLIAFSMIALQFIAGFVQHISGHIVNSGLSLTTGASVVSGVMMGAAVGKILIGYLLDKFNNSFVVGLYTVFGILGWSGLIVLKSPMMLVSSGFILGLGQGLLLVALPYFIRREFGSKDYSNILSIISMLRSVSSAAAVSLDGVMFDIQHSYTMPLTLNVILYILAGIAVVMSIRYTHKLLVSKV